MREVATLLGHASVDTTMIDTEQDALDVVPALERTAPDTVAVERIVQAGTGAQRGHPIA